MIANLESETNLTGWGSCFEQSLHCLGTCLKRVWKWQKAEDPKIARDHRHLWASMEIQSPACPACPSAVATGIIKPLRYCTQTRLNIVAWPMCRRKPFKHVSWWKFLCHDWWDVSWASFQVTYITERFTACDVQRYLRRFDCLVVINGSEHVLHTVCDMDIYIYISRLSWHINRNHSCICINIYNIYIYIY